MTEKFLIFNSEIISQLETLGFHNIKPPLLHEYKKDLLKLARYDQQQLTSHALGHPKTITGEYNYQEALQLDYPDLFDYRNKPRTQFDWKLPLDLSDTVSRGRTEQSTKIPKKHLQACKSAKAHICVRELSPHQKCDPVALRKYYEVEWNNYKFPGFHHHHNLRWEVRDKLARKQYIPRIIPLPPEDDNRWPSSVGLIKNNYQQDPMFIKKF